MTEGDARAMKWEDKVAEAPAAPGVYLFKDEGGKVLYVGKAKNLRNRLKAYTKDSGDTRQSVVFLRLKIRDLEVIVTDTEKEALILENNLIKKHRPRYNIDLRDDKTFFHLRLTMSEDFPRLELTRRPKKGGKDILLGPFSSSGAAKETIRIAQDIFPLRRCKSRELRHRDRPCLNYQIGKCSGACAGKISKEDYAKIVEEARRFLKGGGRELIAELRAEMDKASEALEFEEAAVLRDRIAAIETTLEKQKVDSVRPVDRDIWGIHREGDRVAVHRLGYRGGVLLISRSHQFTRVHLNDDEVMASVLTQTYAEDTKPPAEILVSLEPFDREFLEESFSEALGKKVVIRVPERGEGRELSELAVRNAREAAQRESERKDDRERAIAELKSRLRLSKEPRWIECVDISILGGENAVGSVVKFVDGEPDKGGYRRYRIKGVTGVDDYAMMREVLTRRFRRALDEGSPLPDFLILDGGKGQLNIARAVFKDLAIDGPELAGLAKDREIGEALSDELIKKGERVFRPGAKDPVFLKPGTASLHLIARVRDEAHRFAISYHKLLRGKKLKRSSLEDIPGIGPSKARALLKHFSSLAKIREASPQALLEVEGISESDAKRIVEFFEEDV